MATFPGLMRTEELKKPSFGGHSRILEPSPPPVDDKARTQAIDSPYFKSQSNGEIASVKFAQRAKDVLASSDRKAQSSTPRVEPRNTPVSPPVVKRNLDRVASESSVTDVLPSFEIPGLPVRSPDIQASKSSARDARAITDTDLLHAMNSKPRRGPSDDTSSIFSGETRLSGSTSSRTKENTCRECKFKGHANLPLIKCSTCTNRFHANEKCINPKLCDVKNKEVFRCRQCVSKGRTRVVASLPNSPAEYVSVLPSNSNDLTCSSNAITRSPSPIHAPEPDGHIRTKKDSQTQQPDHNNVDRMAQDESKRMVAMATPSDLPDDLVVAKVRSVDMSIVPKEPAAMRETSSPVLHKLPYANNLMDSYRPDNAAPPVATRGHDFYRPSERSRPPPLHLRREREIFLRNASKEERDHYLRQNRKDICKEITCPHWPNGDCKHGDKCMYSHQHTGSYFPSVRQPSKEWTCFSWLGHTGCRDHEEDCPFSHYDTGIYVGPRGLASTKHVTCFWWFDEDGACRNGADCHFAHYNTGILAADPRVPRRERNATHNRPSSPIRNFHDSWRPKASTNNTPQALVASSQPPVRDTPLSPILPSESGSEENEPPAIRPSPQHDDYTALSVTPAHLQPPVRDTPLNPILPSESDSEENEPPAIRQSPQQDGYTALSVMPAHLQPQADTEPSPTAGLEPASSAARSTEHLQALEPNGLGKSKPSPLDATQAEEAPVAAVVRATVPIQTARRTGHRNTGSRRKRQETGSLEHSQGISGEIAMPTKHTGQDVPTQPLKTSDPRLRKPVSSSLESSPNINADKTGPAKSEVQGKITQPESFLQPVEKPNPSILKCQNCAKLVFVNQAAKHKCQGKVSDQVSVSQQPSSCTTSSRKNDISLPSRRSHPLVQDPPINDQDDQVNEPDMTIAPDNMGHVLSRDLPDSSVPKSAIHGPKRSASVSGVDDLFLPNKRRKMGRPMVPRALTSAVSPITAQAPALVSAKPKKAPAVSLSIGDLTELAALQKEFNCNEESQSDDDATTLKFLQARKRKKLDREERLAREEEAEEAAHKEKRRKKWEAEEAADEARLIAEREKRRKRWDEELAQEERYRQAFKESVGEQAAQERRKSPNQVVEAAAASRSSTSPSSFKQRSTINSAPSSLRGASVPTPGQVSLRQSSDEDPAATQEIEKRFNGLFSVISPNLGTNTAQTSAPLSTSHLHDDAGEQNSILKNRSELFSISDEQDTGRHETTTANALTSQQLGPKQTACVSCRRDRVTCRHDTKPLSSVGAQPQIRSLDSSVPISEPQQMDSDRSSLLEADSLEAEPTDDEAQNHQSRKIACASCQKSKRRCYHDPLTGKYDPVRAELPPKKQQRVTSDNSRISTRKHVTPDIARSDSAPLKSAASQVPLLEPMFSSIVAGISATKTATSAFAQTQSAIVPVSVTADPVTTLSGDNYNAEAEADKSLARHPLPSTDLSPTYQEDNIPRSCADCGMLPPKRLRRFGPSRHLLCDTCYMYNYCAKTNVDRPINRELNSEDCAADDSSAPKGPPVSIAAGLKAAKALASEAIAKGSEPVPSSIAPAEILALFCQPLPSLVETDKAANIAVPWSDVEQDKDHMGPRLVQSRVLNEEEAAAAIARLRAQGIEVVSVSGDSDSDSSWSGSEAGESLLYPFRPVSLVKNARYEDEPDPQRWVVEVEDQKAKTFDFEAAQKRIKARPGLKENVKALQNCTKPGKLLAISDWRGRVEKYGNFYREIERDPGPQKLGTYIREVADRTKLTIASGLDDPEIMKEVQGTMHEFLDIPRQVKYDLMNSDRLVGARTLAFSDAARSGRVPDRDKFPVGKGG